MNGLILDFGIDQGSFWVGVVYGVLVVALVAACWRLRRW